MIPKNQLRKSQKQNLMQKWSGWSRVSCGRSTGDVDDVGHHDAVVGRRQPHSDLVILAEREHVEIRLNGMDNLHVEGEH